MISRLYSVVARTFKVPAESLTSESGPHTIPAWDSAGHMSLILELEKEFGIQFDEDEVVELVSLEAISEALSRRGIAS